MQRILLYRRLPCAVLATLSFLALTFPRLLATELDTIGVTALRAREPALVGTGVSLAMVEFGGGTGRYQPNPTLANKPPNNFQYFDSAFPYPAGTAFSVGKESGHANDVASNYFDGVTGVASGASAFFCFEALYYINTFMPSGGNPGASVVSQSFVANAESPGIDELYDAYSDFYKILFVNGVNNTTAAPPSPATMYNGIAVGLPTGSVSSIGPAANGRCKPDIVAPSSATSFATPYVAGSAAVLIQAGTRGDGGVGLATIAAATDPRTVKALLLNGAIKPSAWTRSLGRPLDVKLGAGVLNVNRAHLQLIGGKHMPNSSESIVAGGPHLPPPGILDNLGSIIGWNQKSLSNTPLTDAVDHYFLELPAEQSGAFDLVATLTWNRLYGQTSLNNLDFFLYNADTNVLVASSTSTVDNVEHLYVQNLATGRYVLQVVKLGSGHVTDSDTYAMAFEFTPLPPPSAPTGMVANTNSDSQISLGWNDTSSNETGFRIYRSLTPLSGFSEIASVGPNTTSYADSGLSPETTYYYQVRSVSLAGESTSASAQASTYSLLQAWRVTHFGSPDNSGNGANTSDWDADGVPNLIEYALGTHPRSNAAAQGTSALPSVEIAYDGPNAYLTMSVVRAAARADILYTVQVGSSPGNWSNNTTTLINSPTLLKVRDNIPVPTSGSQERFIRLHVSE